jgi:hypothetical protein
VVLRARVKRTDQRRLSKLRGQGRRTCCGERRLAWLLLHYWERSLNTHDWNDFWPRLFLFAFSAASGEIASGNFSFCQCCISKRLGRDISVLALLCFLVHILLGAALCLPCILSVLSTYHHKAVSSLLKVISAAKVVQTANPLR